MKKSRLLKLAALLETVDPKNFDMGTWGRAKRSAKKSPQCCTRACALGWATAIPEFHAAGLRLVAEEFAPKYGVVRFGDLEDFDAAEAFFGIDSQQSNYLFCLGSDKPAEKAKEIRALVRHGYIHYAE